MRRRGPRPERSPFAVWLDAINCRDPEWLAVIGEARFSGDEDRLCARWRAWPGHRRYTLWWVS